MVRAYKNTGDNGRGSLIVREAVHHRAVALYSHVRGCWDGSPKQGDGALVTGIGAGLGRWGPCASTPAAGRPAPACLAPASARPRFPSHSRPASTSISSGFRSLLRWQQMVVTT
jgi:hypothetical protein